MGEVMKDFLSTYAHIINTAIVIAVLGFLLYLGSTMKHEEEFISPEPVVEETVVEPIPEPEPVIVPDPVVETEPIVEPEPMIEEVVKEVVEVEEDTVVIDTVEDTVEVEVDSVEAPVEVKADSTDKADSTYTREFTEHFDVTVSVDGYLIVPDSVDNIVNAFVYAAERVGRNTFFIWRDSTYTTKDFYANKNPVDK